MISFLFAAIGFLGTILVGGIVVAVLLGLLYTIIHVIMWILDELNI